MPKSKRNKQVDLSKTRKKGFEGKKQLLEEVQNCIDQYTNIFVFSVNDMRNAKMKDVRNQWRHSRFFIGKNKVMALALGKTPESEYRPNLHKISKQLKGERGLLFSNKSTEEVISWFQSYSEADYARSGSTASEDVSLKEGPLPQFPHSIEPYLRQLGLPTTLQKGIVHLIKDHEVCKFGDTLTPEVAKILKLLDYEMAEFSVKIECHWSQNGTFENLVSKEGHAEDDQENVSPKKTAARNGEEGMDTGVESTEVPDDIGDEDEDHSKKAEENEESESENEEVENEGEENNNLEEASALTARKSQRENRNTKPYVSPAERRLRSRTIKIK